MPRLATLDRHSAYARVLEPMLERDEFTPREIQSVCREQRPSLVAQVVRRLARDELLVASAERDEPLYRWLADRRQFVASEWIARQLAGRQITNQPPEDRPRERLLRLGAAQLRTAELLAILIRSGRPGESALEAGERLSNRYSDQLETLRDATAAELKSISPAVSATAFCQIMAGVELGRRVAEALEQTVEDPRLQLNSTASAIEYCVRRFARLARDRRQEEFHIVTLDTKLHPIAQHQITVGTLDASLVAPREVFRPALRDAAAAVLLVHNHPSGDPTPSRQDLQVTEAMETAARLLGIQVVDHIIVAGGCGLSLKEWKRQGRG